MINDKGSNSIIVAGFVIAVVFIVLVGMFTEHSYLEPVATSFANAVAILTTATSNAMYRLSLEQILRVRRIRKRSSRSCRLGAEMDILMWQLPCPFVEPRAAKRY